MEEVPSFLGPKRKHPVKEKKEESKGIEGGRFRILNEQLYSKPSEESFTYFKENTDDFVAYHEGF